MTQRSGSAPWWLLAFAALALFLAAPALGSPPPSANLLQNPGAEAGASGHGQLVGVPGWDLTGSFTVDHYGDTDRPSTALGQTIYGDKNYFFGGPGGAVSTATQTVDVSAYADEIDKSALDVSFGGYLGGYASQHDSMDLRGDFLGADGVTLKTIAITGPSQFSAGTSFRLTIWSDAVPAGTRSIRVTLTATRRDGSNNDGYADNVQLFLRERTPTGTARLLGAMVLPVAAKTLFSLRASNAAAAVSLLAPKVAIGILSYQPPDGAKIVALLAPKVAAKILGYQPPDGAKILASMPFAAGLKVLRNTPPDGARVGLLKALPPALALRYRKALGP